MQPSKHILVIRFSAMGDVAMTVPVIKTVLKQNPHLQMTVVSAAFLEPLFQGIDRCNFYAGHLKGKHKGVKGLYALYRELTSLQKFDAVIDLHNVLRSKIVRLFFRLGNCPVYVVDKGRSEKKMLTRKENKVFQPLKSMHERYADVFRKGNIQVDLKRYEDVAEARVIPESLNNILPAGKKILGIAPFAQYEEKMYPPDKMKNIVSQLSKRKDIMILLFGGGKNETEILQQWEAEMPEVYCIAGRFSFAEELSVIRNLHAMVSMDSANMHLASLFDVPVVSIWGGTHPFAGFNGWKQDVQNIAQIDLPCRPCSVFGNKPCFRKDRACMEMLSEENIIRKITLLLHLD